MDSYALAAAGFAVVAAGVVTLVMSHPSEKALLKDWMSAVPPWPVFNAANALARLLDNLRDAVVPPPIRTTELLISYTKSQVLYALAKLDIPEHLASGPKTADELAKLSGVPDASKLFRVLRLAVVQRVLAGDSDASGAVRFRNNKISACLRDDHPNSLKYLTTHFMEDCWGPWEKLVPGLQQDKLPWDMWSPNEDFWTWMKNRPESEERFSKAMTALDAVGINAALADYDWGAYSRVIDVGGAYGSMLAGVLKSCPNTSGVLFDLPQVVDRAKSAWKETRAELLPRAEFVGGSFFEPDSVPKAKGPGDCYVMRVVLHDWSDEKSVAILKSVRAAIGDSGAKLAIVEFMPDEGLKTKLEAIPFCDVHMQVLCDGKERTRAQWQALCKAADFRISRVSKTRSAFSVTEAVGV